MRVVRVGQIERIHPLSSNATITGLLDEMFAAFNAHDAAKVVSLMTEDCVFETAVGPEEHGARHVGRAAVKTAFENVWAAMPDVRWDVTGHFVAGDRAVSEWVFRATRADGGRIEVEGCDLFTLRDGKVSVKRAFRKDRPVLTAKA
jgi:taurine dehydrogenase small subunit